MNDVKNLWGFPHWVMRGRFQADVKNFTIRGFHTGRVASDVLTLASKFWRTGDKFNMKINGEFLASALSVWKPAIGFNVNFDADVKKTTARHQCENRFKNLFLWSVCFFPVPSWHTHSSVSSHEELTHNRVWNWGTLLSYPFDVMCHFRISRGGIKWVQHENNGSFVCTKFCRVAFFQNCCSKRFRFFLCRSVLSRIFAFSFSLLLRLKFALHLHIYLRVSTPGETIFGGFHIDDDVSFFWRRWQLFLMTSKNGLDQVKFWRRRQNSAVFDVDRNQCENRFPLALRTEKVQWSCSIRGCHTDDATSKFSGDATASRFHIGAVDGKVQQNFDVTVKI